MKAIKPSNLELVRKESGQMLMVVKFNDGSSWAPCWSEIRVLWMEALLTELLNLGEFKKGDPCKYLIDPILDFLGEIFNLSKDMQSIELDKKAVALLYARKMGIGIPLLNGIEIIIK